MGTTDGIEGDGEPDPQGASERPAPEEIAWSALRAASMRAGVDVADARLWRTGSHFVYRVPRGIIARVSVSESGLPTARRAVAVARWLESVDFPAARLVPGIAQPIAVEGCVVTFWRLVAERERWADLGQVGELLRRLHWLEEPASLGLEQLDPLGETRRDIASIPGLSDDDLAFLAARTETLAARYTELDFVLPRGMVHGDANVGNVLLDDDGRPVLADLDGCATGPREWDLATTALYFERLGWHTRSEYEAFVEGYGFDVMSWYGYSTLADVRELMMTVWLGRKAATDPAAAVEVERRIHDLRTSGDRHGWRPF